MPAGLRLSAHKDLLRSGQATKDMWHKPLVKVMAYSELLPKHGALVLLGELPSKGMTSTLSPPALQHCLGWNSYLNPGWRASILQGRFPPRNILALCIIRTCPCSEGRRSSSMIKLSHPSCTESIRTGPSLIRAAVTRKTFSVDNLAATLPRAAPRCPGGSSQAHPLPTAATSLIFACSLTQLFLKIETCQKWMNL